MASRIWVSIGSDTGLAPVRRQAITWASDDNSSVRLEDTNFKEISIMR